MQGRPLTIWGAKPKRYSRPFQWAVWLPILTVIVPLLVVMAYTGEASAETRRGAAKLFTCDQRSRGTQVSVKRLVGIGAGVGAGAGTGAGAGVGAGAGLAGTIGTGSVTVTCSGSGTSVKSGGRWREAVEHPT